MLRLAWHLGDIGGIIDAASLRLLFRLWLISILCGPVAFLSCALIFAIYYLCKLVTLVLDWEIGTKLVKLEMKIVEWVKK